MKKLLFVLFAVSTVLLIGCASHQPAAGGSRTGNLPPVKTETSRDKSPWNGFNGKESAESIAEKSLRYGIFSSYLSPEEKAKIIARYLKNYKPVPSGYEGVVYTRGTATFEKREKAIESGLKGKGLSPEAGSGPEKPVGLKETPFAEETRLKEIPLKFYVPILKPSRCRSVVGYTEISPPRRGFYAVCPTGKTDECVKAAEKWRLQVYETRIPGKTVYLIGPFEGRWMAVDFTKKAGIRGLDPEDVIFRRTLSGMRLYLTGAGKCTEEAEELVKEFAEKVKTAKGRYEALGLYPLVVSKLEKATVSREAVLTFYDAARRLFFDLGYLDLAWDAALAKVKVAGDFAGLADYELLVAIAKATGNRSYQFAAYLAAARGLKDKRPDKALLYYSEALSLRASRDLLLEIADFLESLGEHEEAAEFRSRAFRRWY